VCSSDLHVAALLYPGQGSGAEAKQQKIRSKNELFLRSSLRPRLFWPF
jgi:hypothetical protein